MLQEKRPSIRITSQDDCPALLELYPNAFPEEDLRPLVQSLIEGSAPMLSLAAFENGPIGHVIFTLFTDEEGNIGALLGPLVVHEDWQNKGIGKALIEAGFIKLAEHNIQQVFVLGNPDYYSKNGFQSEQNIAPPYPLPEQWSGAWQSILLPNGSPLTSETCLLPDIWMDKTLWQP